MRGKLLLHTCCGPCATAVLPALEQEGFEVTLFFFNPNIHPFDEYIRRLNSLQFFADRVERICFAPKTYNPREFFYQIQNVQYRCNKCFFLRLNETALWGKKHKFEYFSTTLTVSPYQDVEEIIHCGESIGLRETISFFGRDYRNKFPQTREYSSKLSLYGQSYCGCVYSRWEGVKKKLWRSLSGQKSS